MELILSPAADISQFVALRCTGLNSVNDFGNHVSLGWVDDDKLLAGCVLYNFRAYRGAPIDVEVAFASTTPRWCTKGAIKTVFDLAFNTLDFPRMTARIAKKNRRARRLVEGVGFSLEGVKRRAYNGQQDLIIYGLLKENCKWLTD